MKNVTPQNEVYVQLANTAGHRGKTPSQLYDESYGKDSDASILGIFVFLIPILFVVFCDKKGSIFQDSSLFIEILVAGGLLFRVFASIYVGKLAIELNRNIASWVYMALLAPGSTLIVMGQKKRFREPKSSPSARSYANLNSAVLMNN